MRLYVTRHGQTEWNTEGRMQGHKDSPLTQNGIDNARLLGKHLEDVRFDCVYSSPLRRAMHTAELIVGDRPLEIIPSPELQEMGFGIWEGRCSEELCQLYPQQYDNFWSHPEAYKPVEGGESFEGFKNRVNRWLNEIILDKPNENILVVTHTCVIKELYSIINNLQLKDFWSDPRIHDTCLSIIEIKDGKSRFLLEADTSHLR
jgi:probable phosphoglycerate mutase